MMKLTTMMPFMKYKQLTIGSLRTTVNLRKLKEAIQNIEMTSNKMVTL